MKLLEEKLRCIAICSRGYGYSSYNTPIKSFKDLAEDVELLIKEHFKFRDKIYLLGQSFGAITALYIASSMPDLVIGMIQISPISLTGWKLEGIS